MVAPNTAKARARDRSENISWINAVIGVKNIPPASPWTARPMMSCMSPRASPHARLATVNNDKPAMNTHLCPSRSPTLPAGMRASPNASE